MKKNWNKKMLPLVFSSALLAFASCGEDGSSKKSVSENQQQLADEGAFRATLTGLNSSVAGNPSGTADVTVNGDNVTIKVTLNGAPVTMHAQHIHDGSTCPTTGADTNGDGVVDEVEGRAVTGKILLPLDTDINTQDAGKDNYPSGSTINYTQTGSLNQMLSDLISPDDDPNDEIVKLPSGSTDINLEGKVVEIHGVPASTNLPGTAQAGDPTKTPQDELPIACGVLTKVTGGSTTGTTTGGAGTTTGGTATGTTTGTTGADTTTGGTMTGTTTGGDMGTTTGGTGTTTGGDVGTTTGTTGTGTTTGETTSGCGKGGKC